MFRSRDRATAEPTRGRAARNNRCTVLAGPCRWLTTGRNEYVGEGVAGDDAARPLDADLGAQRRQGPSGCAQAVVHRRRGHMGPRRRVTRFVREAAPGPPAGRLSGVESPLHRVRYRERNENIQPVAGLPDPVDPGLPPRRQIAVPRSSRAVRCRKKRRVARLARSAIVARTAPDPRLGTMVVPRYVDQEDDTPRPSRRRRACPADCTTTSTTASRTEVPGGRELFLRRRAGPPLPGADLKALVGGHEDRRRRLPRTAFSRAERASRGERDEGGHSRS